MKYSFAALCVTIFMLLLNSCASTKESNLDSYFGRLDSQFGEAADVYFSQDYNTAKSLFLEYNRADTVFYNYESYAFLAECYKQLGITDSGRVVYKYILERLRDTSKVSSFANEKFMIYDLESWQAIYPEFPFLLKKENGFVPKDIMPEPIGGASEIAKNVVYPDIENGQQKTGRIYVYTLINEKGIPVDFKISQSLSAPYDQAAISAIKKVKFTQPKRKGRPCKTWVSLPVSFK